MPWTRPMPHCKDHLQTKKCVTNRSTPLFPQWDAFYFISFCVSLFCLLFILFCFLLGSGARTEGRYEGDRDRSGIGVHGMRFAKNPPKVLKSCISQYHGICLSSLFVYDWQKCSESIWRICVLFQSFLYLLIRASEHLCTLNPKCLQRRLVPGKHPLPCLRFVILDQAKKRIKEWLESLLPLCWKLLPLLQPCVHTFKMYLIL